MRFAVIFLPLVWAALLPGRAHADLYRWIDPDSGTVKFSSYPPPWYVEGTQRRGAPKVEHIPARALRGADAQADRAEGAAEPGPTLDALELRRKAMLQQIAATAGRGGADRGQVMQKQLEALVALTEQMDKLNPEGAAARRADAEVLLQRLIRGEAK